MDVLRNMCNGMRGKNADTLTYRGPDLSERDDTRKLAGCVDKFCAKKIAAGLVPANFNSCDEYPPASSLEGGNARPAIQCAINCIPARQNSSQGGKFGGLQSNLRVSGQTFQKGDKFVISIDVMPYWSQPATERNGTKSGWKGVPKRLGWKEGIGDQYRRQGTARELCRLETKRSQTVDPSLFLEEGQTLSYLLVPFGDLSPGKYSTNIKCDAGSTVGAYVFDGDGYNITANDAGTPTSQTQELTFTLQYATIGVAVLIGTRDNSTKVTWNLDGALGNFTSTTTTTSAATSSASVAANGAEHREITWG